MYPVAKKAKSTLGCVWKSMGSRMKEVILPFLSVVRLHLDYCVQLWASQFRRDMNVLDKSSKGKLK